MNYEEIIKIMKTASELNVASFEIAEGNLHLSVDFAVKGQTTTYFQPENMSDTFSVSQTENHMETSKAKTEENSCWTVKAPLVGIFYASAVENGEPLVKVGDQVKVGQTLAIIEAMKLMNEIEADKDGVITEILVKNGQSVEYGQPLFCIQDR